MKTHQVHITPEGKTITARDGDHLKQVLDQAGYLFANNCGGQGKCLNCRVTFVSPPPLPTDLELRLIGPGSPIRMACQHRIRDDLTIEIQTQQLDNACKRISQFDFRSDQDHGFGVAVDLGTTTVAFYIIDFSKSLIIGQYSFLNPQAVWGGDVMSRLEAASKTQLRPLITGSIQTKLAQSIRNTCHELKLELKDFKRCLIAGNTAMTHFWLGHAGEGLEQVPFTSFLEQIHPLDFSPELIGLPTDCACTMVPILAGFIGGDTTAAIMATNLDVSTGSRLLIDLGTNGEIVLAHEGRLIATSTAAGPAFEGVGMYSGMPAQTGAIESISTAGTVKTIGDAKPVGFCGSGYISAISHLLRSCVLAFNGLLQSTIDGERCWSPQADHTSPPWLTISDVRNFQLAKAAVAAGIEILGAEVQLNPADLDEIILTGAFGHRIEARAALDVGLIPTTDLSRIRFLENAAGRGAIMSASHEAIRHRSSRLQERVQVLNLGDRSDFQERFVHQMWFNNFK